MGAPLSTVHEMFGIMWMLIKKCPSSKVSSRAAPRTASNSIVKRCSNNLILNKLKSSSKGSRASIGFQEPIKRSKGWKDSQQTLNMCNVLGVLQIGRCHPGKMGEYGRRCAAIAVQLAVDNVRIPNNQQLCWSVLRTRLQIRSHQMGFAWHCRSVAMQTQHCRTAPYFPCHASTSQPENYTTIKSPLPTSLPMERFSVLHQSRHPDNTVASTD